MSRNLWYFSLKCVNAHATISVFSLNRLKRLYTHIHIANKYYRLALRDVLTKYKTILAVLQNIHKINLNVFFAIVFRVLTSVELCGELYL